jgi:uncharacterized membrane protein YbhN (UPF0104 family)
MSEQDGDKRARLPWLRLAGTLLAVGLLIVLLAKQGWGEITAAIAQVSWPRFGLALLLTLLSRLAVTGRWHVLLRSGGVPVSLGQSLRITFAGLFASNFLPTTIGGDVVRLAGAVRLGFDKAISLASLVVDRLIGMAGMALAVPLSLPALLGQNLGLSSAMPWLAVAPAKPGWWDSLREKAANGWGQFWQALGIWLRQPRALLLALGFTFLHMALLFTSISLLLDGMGDAMPFWLIAGLWSLTYFVTLLPISLNGLGVQELSMIFFFTQFGGVTQANGLALALLVRILQMLASLPGAAFVPGMIAGERQ